MSNGTRIFAAAGLCLLALAAVCWQSSQDKLQDLDSMKPLNWNISIRQGVILDAEFHTRHDGRHIIELDIDRTLPHKESNCLLGISHQPKDECAEEKNALSLKWEVLNGDTIITNGSTNEKGGGYWGTTTGRVLGRFDAVKDTPYRLRVTGTANEALNAAHPRIRVSIDPRRHKGAYASSSFYAMIALALACVGGAMLLQVLVVVVYRRIRPGQEGN